MNSRSLFAVGVVFGLGALVLAGAAITRGDDEEQELDLMRVPAAVRDAASKAVAGFEPRTAEVEAILVYELQGTAGDKTYEIEVSGEGQVIESEAEADDAEDDDTRRPAARDANRRDDDDRGSDAEDDDSDSEADESEHELDIPLSAVPQKVKAAAEKAVPGVKLSEAAVESVLVYELSGSAGGKAYEIEVSSEGEVLESEQASDDD